MWPNLVNEVLPVLDQHELAFIAVLILRQLEGGASTPQVKFSQRLANCHLTLCSLVQLLQHQWLPLLVAASITLQS